MISVWTVASWTSEKLETLTVGEIYRKVAFSSLIVNSTDCVMVTFDMSWCPIFPNAPVTCPKGRKRYHVHHSHRGMNYIQRACP